VKIPIFIINLKKDTQKKLHMQELCAKYGLQPEFIEAVDGKSLTVEDMAKTYSNALAIEKLGRELSKGEIGCALSHKNVYKKMIDENIEMALILEDDVDFDNKLVKSLREINKLPYDWEVILLGHHTGSSREIRTQWSIWYKQIISEEFILRRPCEVGYGAYGYYLNRKGAEKLYNHLDLIRLPIDHYTGNYRYINLYVVQDPLVLINKGLTILSNLALERSALQSSLFEVQRVSFKKKVAQALGLYQLLVNLLENIKMLIKKIRFLKKYDV